MAHAPRPPYMDQFEVLFKDFHAEKQFGIITDLFKEKRDLFCEGLLDGNHEKMRQAIEDVKFYKKDLPQNRSVLLVASTVLARSGHLLALQELAKQAKARLGVEVAREKDFFVLHKSLEHASPSVLDFLLPASSDELSQILIKMCLSRGNDAHLFRFFSAVQTHRSKQLPLSCIKEDLVKIKQLVSKWDDMADIYERVDPLIARADAHNLTQALSSVEDPVTRRAAAPKKI